MAEITKTTGFQSAEQRLRGAKYGLLRQDIAITDTATELFTITTPGIYRIWVKNLGATTTNSFLIQGRNSSDATWKTIVSTTADYTTIPTAIANFLLSSDDTINPTALAQNEEWNGAIDCTNFAFIQVTSTVASGSTTLKVEVN